MSQAQAQAQATTALLLIDVQQSFRARPYWSDAEAPAFFERTNALLAGAAAQGIPVVRIFHTGPANTILANVVRSEIRATAFAINILIIHALGDAISPLIIGNIGDRTSLQTAFLGVSLLIPLSGVLWIWGAKYLDEDTRRAEAA